LTSFTDFQRSVAFGKSAGTSFVAANRGAKSTLLSAKLASSGAGTATGGAANMIGAVVIHPISAIAAALTADCGEAVDFLTTLKRTSAEQLKRNVEQRIFIPITFTSETENQWTAECNRA
jgi:hypothetical protein